MEIKKAPEGAEVLLFFSWASAFLAVGCAGFPLGFAGGFSAERTESGGGFRCGGENFGCCFDNNDTVTKFRVQAFVFFGMLLNLLKSVNLPAWGGVFTERLLVPLVQALVISTPLIARDTPRYGGGVIFPNYSNF